ncbi:hypothetical protein J7E70_12115 [Variovorax paradoxus]|nr:hypothetical protein [Variovorax paradoxus]MBT2301206.1 hypothetical protein [Variovorax paradoxus]
MQTIVDGPQGFANSVPLLAETTYSDYALGRLHGRNVDTYNIKGRLQQPSASTTTIQTRNCA